MKFRWHTSAGSAAGIDELYHIAIWGDECFRCCIVEASAFGRAPTAKIVAAAHRNLWALIHMDERRIICQRQKEMLKNRHGRCLRD